MRLSQKVALIFGAGSSGPGWGNGKASAVLYAREGARVFAVDIDESAANETRQLIEDEGGECVAHAADVARPEQIAGAVARCQARFGAVDVLHNNVGIVELGGPIEISVDNWNHLLDVNVRAMFLACKYVLPMMVARRRGAIINIASVAGRVALPHRVIYSAVEAGKMMFTRALACEWAADGVRVNAIAPGTIMTDLVRRNFALGLLDGDRVLERTPLGRFGEPSEVAEAAVFLASDRASYITGHTLFVDGGWTSWAGWAPGPTKTTAADAAASDDSSGDGPR